MPGQELEELPRVALIGVEGQGGEAPLKAKRLQPIDARVEKILTGGDKEFLHGGSRLASGRYVERFRLACGEAAD